VMGREINLLDSLPQIKRNIAQRESGVPRGREVAMKFGREYFDGDRTQGYGGYRYDGRWVGVARRMREYYGLQPGARILDIGCAKGFFMHDFLGVLGRATVVGLEISSYAIENSLQTVQGRMFRGTADHLPFPDKSFDLVVAINAIHNLPLDRCRRSLSEIERVGRAHKYVQVDSWLSDEQRRNFERWVLTAQTYFEPDGWRRLFSEAGYTGDYFWTLTE